MKIPRSLARIYRRAAKLIEGWGELGTGDWCENGKHCAEGALLIAAGYNPGKRKNWHFEDAEKQLGTDFAEKVCTLPNDPSTRWYAVNDTVLTDLTDAERARRIAKKLREYAGPAR